MEKNIENIINESLFDEAKKIIIKESATPYPEGWKEMDGIFMEPNSPLHKSLKKETVGEGKEVYHIMCNKQPVDTFDTEEEANTHLDIYKKEHPEKEFIIEKTNYDSHSHMIDTLDEMGEKLENKTNTMENKKVKSMAEAILDAKEKGLKSFKVGNEKYNVDECWKQLEEEEGACDECSQKMEEVEECNDEETTKEKHTISLSETEFVNMISKIIVDSYTIQPDATTKKAQTGSKRENDQAMSDVEKKMKDYLKFDGNDNPEFPHPIGKGEKVAINNTPEEDEFVADNRGRGMENLEYDHEPSEEFKKRQKMALEGDPKMGNGQEGLNAIKSKTGEKIEKEVKRKHEEKVKEPMYKKEAVPVKTIKESKLNMSSILEEELNKMKNLTTYNKKTQ